MPAQSSTVQHTALQPDAQARALAATPSDATPALRPADFAMGLPRAAATVPNAMCFSRSAMRELVRGRWKIEKLRFALDTEGRGEILYRLVGGGWVFHFFLVSTKLPEEQKTDRNFAQSWDAMGVLCQGEWTAEREAHLRREVPKQRAGFADYDTLVYARGNRSARLFDHVVASLADGRQPDLGEIAPVGYILRTTAFIGNGQLGTKGFAGLGPDHPLRRPYHVQFCSAFMLREYVYDLVDHMARCRNPRAVRLAPEYRRYLGLGNAAATGLVAFVTNHPHFMHYWTLASETVLAQALVSRAGPRDAVGQRFGALLDRALQHFSESERAGDGVFATDQVLIADLRRLREMFSLFAAQGTVEGQRTDTPWQALAAWCRRHLHLEALEIFNAIVIELHPEMVDAQADAFITDERFALRPEMDAATLRALLLRHYGWALVPREGEDDWAHYFWYRTTRTPRDVRRALRGRVAQFEAETTQDTVLMVRRLWSCIAQADGATTVAVIVREQPQLRHATARVQTMAGLDYAELRSDWLSQDFSPFAPIRFALSFFGMDKVEAARPKSVRGTFMQGAPIAQDVAAGRDGDWPFPVKPAGGATESGASAGDGDLAGRLGIIAPTPPPFLAVTVCEMPPMVRLAPAELARMAQNAMQGHGASLGVAEEAGRMMAFAHQCGRPAIPMLLAQCAAGLVERATRATLEHEKDSHAVFDAHGGCALVAAPAALDLALVRAASAQGSGIVLVRNAAGTSLLGELALRCAQRGLSCAVMWMEGSAGAVAIAGAGDDGPWFEEHVLASPCALHASLCAQEGVDASDSFVIACMRNADDLSPDAVRAELVEASASIKPSIAWTAQQLRRAQEDAHRDGLVLASAEFQQLDRAAAALLVPDAQEHRVLAEGMDPLKDF